MQDYSDEWRAALIERDMAVRAIVGFLDALGDEEDERPSLEMLRRIRAQLEKKLSR